MFVTAQERGCLVGRLHDVAELDALDVLFGDEAGRVDVEAEEADFLAGYGLDYVWGEDSIEVCVGEVVVGRRGFALERLPVLGEVGHAVVELVVAEHAYVVSHHVHEFVLHVALEIREVEGTLHGVACVDQQHVAVGASHRVDDGLALERSAHATFVGVYLRVNVVGAEQGDFLRLQRLDACRHQRDEQQDMEFIHGHEFVCSECKIKEKS